MRHRFQRARLTPDGFIVDGVKVVAEDIQILLRSRQPLGTCPDCGRRNWHVQLQGISDAGDRGKQGIPRDRRSSSRVPVAAVFAKLSVIAA